MTRFLPISSAIWVLGSWFLVLAGRFPDFPSSLNPDPSTLNLFRPRSDAAELLVAVPDELVETVFLLDLRMQVAEVAADG